MSSSTRVSPASLLKVSSDVAAFYGFRPLRELERVLPASERPRSHSFNSASHVCLTHASLRSEPVLAFYASSAPSHLPRHLETPREYGEFGLHVVGAEESVGEVLLLKVLDAILKEWGVALDRVRVNALGDKDSKLRFARELSVYTRRKAHEFCPSCQKEVPQNPIVFFTCKSEPCIELAQNAPRPLNFLSEKSRAHFRELLEHLESLALPYEVDDLLMGDEREPRVVFAVDLPQSDATVVHSGGGRYDDHVRKTSTRKEASCLHANLVFRKKGLLQSHFTLAGASSRTPRVFFVQLGLQAKLRSFVVTEALREARIPVLQSFDTSKLSPQLQAATEAGVSHLLIMGQREAIDGTVIVREIQNSAQTILELAALPRFLKTLR